MLGKIFYKDEVWSIMCCVTLLGIGSHFYSRQCHPTMIRTFVVRGCLVTNCGNIHVGVFQTLQGDIGHVTFQVGVNLTRDGH